MYRASVRQPGGYVLITDPDAPGGKTEADTLQCGHCGGHFFLSEPSGGCYQCGSQICPACVEREVCLPFAAWLDVMEGTPVRGRWAQSFAEWNAKRLGRR